MANLRQGKIPVTRSSKESNEQKSGKTNPVLVEGPYFEDFNVGDDYSDVPGVTITEGYTAVHQAVFGDRLKLPLDYDLSRKVTGVERGLVNPSLVTNIAIGQSTLASQRVVGNLFYRGLCFQAPVFIGDTLKTVTKVVALKQNKPKPNRAATGMVALEMHVRNQKDETVLFFWRCPMIPCRDPNANTGRDDDFSLMPESIPDLEKFVPHWDLAEFRRHCHGSHGDVLEVGQAFRVDSRDTVTLAPEIVRLTLNMAMTHTDASRSVYGKRLVYGGHTISIAASQLTRALPNLVTPLAWHSCEHTAPVFEGDILQSSLCVESVKALKSGHLADLKVEVVALRGNEMSTTDKNAEKRADGGEGTEGREGTEGMEEVKVLVWRLAALFA